ncbi:MAG TPA: iron ABC transporter permease [Alphaproteobacteria bacterium]|jgi:iron(III) transport system permease protein|nr:iron ABC transporter permease [Alphaproteobacteria bacterium]
MSVLTSSGIERVQVRLPKLALASVWNYVVFIVVLALVAVPLTFLVLGSFSAARLPSEFSFSTLNLDNYIKVWTDPGTYAVFGNTVIYAVGSTLVGISIAAALAWLVERTDMPFKIWVYAGVPLTLVMPGMLQAMAWVLLSSPRIGFINVALMHVFGLSKAPFNIYSLEGMIFIEGLRAVPTAFLMLVPLLRSMDPALEEAAATSGARPMSSLRKVTLGLMIPGLLAVTIYQFTSVLEGFEVPGILGLPSGIYVFSTKIYTVLHSASALPAYGEANALGMAYVFIAVVATWMYSRVIGKSERYTIITGKGYRPKVSKLGVWKWPAFSMVIVYLALSTIIPFLVFAYVSFLPFLQAPSAKAFANMSWANYDTIFHTEQLGHMLWNTFIMTVCVATGTVIISFIVSLVVVRTRFWGRKVLDQVAFIPHAIPGMVMGLALLWIYLQIDKLGVGLFGTIWSIVIAFIIGYMSYGTRVMNAALLQVHKDLEDAAKMSGARQWRVMWRVFVPLLLPAITGVWIWSVLHVVRAAGKPLILADGSENEVLAIVIWNMWDQGYVEAVGAMGTILMIVMVGVTLGLRVIGFGRGAHIQGAGQ